MDEISIYIINYNGEDVLPETINSLKSQDYKPITITLIDDGSTDKSVAIAQKYFPEIEIMGLSYNTGFPNKLRRMAIDTAKNRYIFLIDNDIALERNCLSNLLNGIKSEQNIGICTPRLMYYDNRKRIYVCWTKFHYLCLSISPLRDTFTEPESEPVDTLGGGVMLIDKQKIDKIGNIDDSYPMGWGEDAEIYARMKIAGFRTLYVPNAVGYHHAKVFLKERTQRPFGQARNRWHMMLSMYQIKTLILILPAVLLYEIITLFMLIPKKLAKPYIFGILQSLKDLKSVKEKRRTIQKTRKVKDKEFLTSGPIHVPPAYLSNPIYKTGINYINKVFTAYWQLIRVLL